ncbi:hypothetical protein L914_00952 [Phytophthora nicotianae]|uniref:Uncharacterized protein n=1 Tax=Phytophthora nicotianae TaxID=4792 RepID=W2JT91_PHYNI|nr:hypothetical protein L916_00946 [Phytophthora nicotianae]ETM55897.1 hypothetical protein L914_00952 [Phytophthora nicotianae]
MDTRRVLGKPNLLRDVHPQHLGRSTRAEEALVIHVGTKIYLKIFA